MQVSARNFLAKGGICSKARRNDDSIAAAGYVAGEPSRPAAARDDESELTASLLREIDNVSVLDVEIDRRKRDALRFDFLFLNMPYSHQHCSQHCLNAGPP